MDSLPTTVLATLPTTLLAIIMSFAIIWFWVWVRQRPETEDGDREELALLALLLAGTFALALLHDIPGPATAEQIAAAQTYLDGVCVACPVYEIEATG